MHRLVATALFAAALAGAATPPASGAEVASGGVVASIAGSWGRRTLGSDAPTTDRTTPADIAPATPLDEPAPDLAAPPSAFDSDAASSATWLTITDAGIGPVAAGTPFETAAMAQVVAGSEVRTVDAARESGSTRTPAAFVNGQQAVQFFKGPGGTVGEMHGISQHLEGPNGERIGMTMADAGVRRGDCRVGTAEWRGMAVCPARNSRHVVLVFSIPQFAGPFDVLPTEAQLAAAELQRIVWRPGA